MMEGSLSLQLRNKIVDIAGREKGREIINLLLQFGIDVITELGNVDIKLPNLEIQSINPYTGKPGPPPRAMEVVRQHQFICKINGKTDPMIQRIELDPFDYSEAEVLKVRITMIPMTNKEMYDAGLGTD